MSLFSRLVFLGDPDLELLRDDPGYQAGVSGAEARFAAEAG